MGIRVVEKKLQGKKTESDFTAFLLEKELEMRKSQDNVAASEPIKSTLDPDPDPTACNNVT